LQLSGTEGEGVGQKAAPIAVFVPFYTDLVICVTLSLRVAFLAIQDRRSLH
jgi:hypothetical protein